MFEIYPGNNVPKGLQNIVFSFLKIIQDARKSKKNAYYNKQLEELNKIQFIKFFKTFE